MKFLREIIIPILSVFLLLGCHPSYPSNYVEESIKEICRDEYGITDVEVLIKGKTIGVYLPLKQLFSLDYERFLKGQLEGGDLENLVQFHPEALDKVEDVLFSTSRVILSTDRDIDFYMLSATDTLVTGLQFTIIGNILDMKRVRFWDIPRSEYRKRLIHDISINQAVAWKRNVKNFFIDIPDFSLEDLLETYTLDPAVFRESSSYFFEQIQEAKQKEELEYEILDIRAKPLQGREVLVYAKIYESYDEEKTSPQDSFRFKNNFVTEYLFVLSLLGTDFKISQVIPFYFINDEGEVTDIEFPENLKIYQNLDEWPEDFDYEEIRIEDFLADQMTKRIQAMIYEDPKIREEFLGWKKAGKLSIVYEHVFDEYQQEEAEGFFVLNFFLSLRTKLLISTQDLLENEHLQYLMDKILREFTSTLHSYSFKDYAHLDIQLPVADAILMLTKKDINQFRKNKLTIKELLEGSQRFE